MSWELWGVKNKDSLWSLPALKNGETRLVHMKINIMNKLKQHNISIELKLPEVNAMAARIGFLKTQGHLLNGPRIFRSLCFLSLQCAFLLSKSHVSCKTQRPLPYEVFPAEHLHQNSPFPQSLLCSSVLQHFPHSSVCPTCLYYHS